MYESNRQQLIKKLSSDKECRICSLHRFTVFYYVPHSLCNRISRREAEALNWCNLSRCEIICLVLPTKGREVTKVFLICMLLDSFLGTYISRTVWLFFYLICQLGFVDIVDSGRSMMRVSCMKQTMVTVHLNS